MVLPVILRLRLLRLRSDHIKPLKRGGADDPSNMQWQTVEDAKAKDRWEGGAASRQILVTTKSWAASYGC